MLTHSIPFNGILYAARRALRPPFSRRRLSRIGLDWDEDAGELRCHRIERVSAQDPVVTNEETCAEDDRCINYATTGRTLYEAAAYVDAQRPSSSNSMDAREPAALACDHDPVLPHAVAGLGMTVDISVPDDDGTSGLGVGRIGTNHAKRRVLTNVHLIHLKTRPASAIAHPTVMGRSDVRPEFPVHLHSCPLPDPILFSYSIRLTLAHIAYPRGPQRDIHEVVICQGVRNDANAHT